MTNQQWWDVAKTALVIVYGVLLLLASFGPLAQYREWLGLVAGVVSIIAGAVGVQLVKPAQQIQNIKASKASGK